MGTNIWVLKHGGFFTFESVGETWIIDSTVTIKYSSMLIVSAQKQLIT